MKPISTIFLCLLLGGPATAQQPLSAIDWLDRPVPVPVAQPPVPRFNEPPVAIAPSVPSVSVTPLAQIKYDAVGLLPSATTGLPLSLWDSSTTDALVTALSDLPARPLPAVQALYYTLLLAEADAPFDAADNARFLRARIEALRMYGAVTPALALVERAGPRQPTLFDLWLDLSLLDGTEDYACAALRQTPDLSPHYGARVYCIARAGDWQTAALTYESAVAVGAISGIEADLLAMYLDPEQVETLPAPPPPRTMTPLIFRLFEAAGSPLPTRRLPRAYAATDLRGTSGWRAEIEAAERLVQVQALPAGLLFGLYTERHAAASGGVWDRVRAIQALETALGSGDAAGISQVLPGLWQAMRSQGLEVAFAQLYGTRLITVAPLPAETQDLVWRIGLLSPEYEFIASARAPATPEQRFLQSIARGLAPAPLTTGHDTVLHQAVAAGFAATGPDPRHQPLLEGDKLGQAILDAAALLAGKAASDAGDITAALRTLRAVGLEDTARRAALQLLLLKTG